MPVNRESDSTEVPGPDNQPGEAGQRGENGAPYRKPPPVFTGRALLEAAAAGMSATAERGAVRSGSSSASPGAASKMAAGGKLPARAADQADRQETLPHSGDGSRGGQEFNRGDLVEHKKFGRGVVTGTQVGRGGDLEIFVRFETVGVKQLLVKFAPLSRL